MEPNETQTPVDEVVDMDEANKKESDEDSDIEDEGEKEPDSSIEDED